MSTLREITSAYREVMNMEGIDPDTWYGTLEAIEGELEVKVGNYVYIREEYKGEFNKFKTEANRLLDICSMYEKRIKRLEEGIFTAMKETGINEVPNEFYKIKIQNNGGVAPLIIHEGVTIPKEYQKVHYDIDNEKIREALKTQKLEFAELGERGSHLVIK